MEVSAKQFSTGEVDFPQEIMKIWGGETSQNTPLGFRGVFLVRLLGFQVLLWLRRRGE